MDPVTIAGLVFTLSLELAKLAGLQQKLASGQELTPEDEALVKAAQEAERALLGANTGHPTN